MKRFVFAVLLVFFSAPARAQAPEVRWEEDYAIAQELALLARKPLLVTFQTSWCGWCRKLESSTFRSEEFKQLASSVVPVRLDGDKNRGLVGTFRVTGYPTTILVSRQGKEIGRIRGYQAAAPFVQLAMAFLAGREPLLETEALAQEQPEDPESVYALGDVLLALRRMEPAREALGRVAALDAQDASGLVDDAGLDLALTYFFAGDPATAVDRLAAFLETYPESDRRDQGIFFHGLALMNLGREEEGIARIREAATITGLEYIKREAGKLESPAAP